MYGKSLLLISISLMSVSSCDVECDLPIPKSYHTLPALSPPKIDGLLTDKVWSSVAWSTPFGDIDSGDELDSTLLTRFKFTYDDEYFYIGAEILDPNAASKECEDKLNFKNSTFTIYIDPLRTNHNYKEIEITPFGKIRQIAWDKPPSDGGVPNEEWSLGPKAREAITIHSGYGTLATRSNNKKKSWTLEWAIPQDRLLTDCKKRGRFDFNRRPGTQFSRFGSRSSRKRTDVTQYKQTWSPQFSDDIQNPEWWGSVFLGDVDDKNQTDVTEVPRFVLSQLYRAQREYKHENGCYTKDITKLDIEGPKLGKCTDVPTIALGDDCQTYTARLVYQDVVGKIRQDRYLTFEHRN
ncbi:hypothetical protein K7432_008727 [Basidiobolus ranarum]|uniref:Carbohydrate-binding domain-containing protein n=1 Tax=Basidiobolus ranarum TaxID=34480 RepID=A0ABR2VY38_9FUNG